MNSGIHMPVYNDFNPTGFYLIKKPAEAGWGGGVGFYAITPLKQGAVLMECRYNCGFGV